MFLKIEKVYFKFGTRSPRETLCKLLILYETKNSDRNQVDMGMVARVKLVDMGMVARVNLVNMGSLG